MAVQVSSTLCIGCGACTYTCPLAALSIVDGLAVVSEQWCMSCGSCVPSCPQEALSVPQSSVEEPIERPLGAAPPYEPE